MNIFESALQLVSLLLAAAAAAILVENVLRQYLRRLTDENARCNAALQVIEDQTVAIKVIAYRESIPLSVKQFIVDISGLVTDRESAHRMADWIERGCPTVDHESDDNVLLNAIARLRNEDVQAFELVISAIRRSLIAMLLQWQETAKCLFYFSHVIASETPNEAAHAAAVMRRVAAPSLQAA